MQEKPNSNENTFENDFQNENITKNEKNDNFKEDEVKNLNLADNLKEIRSEKEQDEKLSRKERMKNLTTKEDYNELLEQVKEEVKKEKHLENFDKNKLEDESEVEKSYLLKNSKEYLDFKEDNTKKDTKKEEITYSLKNEKKEQKNLEKTFITDSDLMETQILSREELEQAIKEYDSKKIQNIKRKKVEKKILPYLEIIDLKKRFGSKTVVEDITFNMYPGEIIGLLGPNGSGKTTIMKMIVALIKPTKGDIYCFEEPLGMGNVKMLDNIGSMIETPAFYNYLSGKANLKQIARLYKNKVTKERIKEITKLVGLEGAINKKVKTYSLGMKQRLGLAGALLTDPKILILDEPVNGLDPQGVIDFRNKLKQIAKTGVSILISSHLLSEIEKISDRIIVLEDGRIKYDDKLENILGSETNKTIIKTYDDKRAEVLIEDLEVDYKLTEQGFEFLNISKEEKTKVLAYLVSNYVEIDTVTISKKTLEERFLEITKKGG